MTEQRLLTADEIKCKLGIVPIGVFDLLQTQHEVTANHYETVIIPARIKEATGRTPDATKDSDLFWKEIIYKDGKIDEEQVLKELADFYFMMQQVPKVYDSLAGLSKPLYFADVVINAANERIDKYYVDKEDAEFEKNAAVEAAEKKLIEEIEEISSIHTMQNNSVYKNGDYVIIPLQQWQSYKQSKGV